MKILLISICWIFQLTNGASQLNLLDNVDITWVGETNFEYIFEDPKSIGVDYYSNDIRGISTPSSSSIVKLDLTEECNYYPYLYFQDKLIESIVKGRLKAVSINEGKQLPTEKIWRILLGKEEIPINLESGEEFEEIYATPAILDFTSYRIRQFWYYSESEKMIFSKPVEIVPIRKIENLSKELFKISLSATLALNQKLNVNSNKAKWILETIDKKPIENSFIDKRGNSIDFFKQLLWQEPRDALTQIYSFDSLCDGDPVSFHKAIEAFGTLFVSYKDIVGMRIEQIWVLNPEDFALESHLKSISPLIVKEYGNSKPRDLVLVPIYTIKN